MKPQPVSAGINQLLVFGAFQMKGCIRVLKEQPPSSVEGLLNALRCVLAAQTHQNQQHSQTGFKRAPPFHPCRYTTKHLNDETTSKQIKNMLQQN